MEVSGQFHALATLPPPQYPMDRIPVEPHSQYGCSEEEENLFPAPPRN